MTWDITIFYGITVIHRVSKDTSRDKLQAKDYITNT